MQQHVGQALAGIFNCLHDGWLESYRAESAEQLTLTISCLYLAERLNPSFSFFRLKLSGLTALEFLPWADSDEEVEKLTAINQIINDDLEILSATYSPDAGVVQIICCQSNPAVPWVGGTLTITCAAVQLFDEGGTGMTLNDLQTLAQNYWADWSVRS